jgi:putative intracellular protease/amidase
MPKPNADPAIGSVPDCEIGGTEFKVDKQVAKADPNSYDALVLPGGQINPDHLRMDKTTIQFIQSFVRSGKPIAAICQGPLTLIEANAVSGGAFGEARIGERCLESTLRFGEL